VSTAGAARWRRRFASLGIRQKLLAMVLLPLLVVLPLLGLVLLWGADAAFDRMLIAKIRADLAVAQGYFERVQGEVGASTQAVADSAALQQALAAGGEAVPRLLQQWRERERLDFLRLLPQIEADRNGVEVLEPSQLELLDAAQRARVPVQLVPTRNAAPTERTREERAMVLIATRRVIDARGRAVGALQGGCCSTATCPSSTTSTSIVYPPGSLPFGSQGTATLFLDDVRISTNVRLFGPAGDERAIGTRVSQRCATGAGQGETWLDRAFVVNDWYVSAYQPLADGAGRRVGMLYVGYLERRSRLDEVRRAGRHRRGLLRVMIAAAWVSLRWARADLPPAGTDGRDHAARRGRGAGRPRGHGGQRRRDRPPGRAPGPAARYVIDDNTRELQRWNAELDAKVAERTRELEDAQAHLVRSEKMAPSGQLTASIAHEVNNPIAVIQGNLDLLRELLGEPRRRPGPAPSCG
jgi:two-component system NtrC family sensor kinase